MIPADFLARLPTTAAILVVSSLSKLAAGHVLPRETKTIGLRALNVVDWPIVATPAPASPADLRRRQFNTICGFIGGDPAFPATCLAGSHCAVDIDHGAIGCCPDGAPCTGGIFTGCVDVNSPPQTELDPYVYTCTANQVCYKNHFDGGFFQYGCGSASHLATTVATTAVSRSALDFSLISVVLTATPTPLSEPTTIGSPSLTPSSSTTATSSGATSTHTSGGSNAGAGSTASSSSTSTSTADPSAPTSSGSSAAGPIVGGVIGGLSGLIVLGILVFWLLRHRKGAAPKQYINPSTEKDDDFGSRPFSRPFSHDASGILTKESPASPTGMDSHEPDSPLGNNRHSNSIGLAVPMDNTISRPSDEIPLTRDSQRSQAGGTAPLTEFEMDSDSYPGPRRTGGGGYLWSQNRSQPRNRNRPWV